MSLCARLQVIAASTDTVHSHLAWRNTPRRQGGLGGLTYPLLSDVTKRLASEYEVLIEEGEDAGVALRYMTLYPHLTHAQAGERQWLIYIRHCKSSRRCSVGHGGT